MMDPTRLRARRYRAPNRRNRSDDASDDASTDTLDSDIAALASTGEVRGSNVAGERDRRTMRLVPDPPSAHVGASSTFERLAAGHRTHSVVRSIAVGRTFVGSSCREVCKHSTRANANVVSAPACYRDTIG